MTKPHMHEVEQRKEVPKERELNRRREVLRVGWVSVCV
jgi:hypothetical protein